MTGEAGRKTGDPARNLTQRIFEELGRAIATGRYDDREFPTEAEIAATHGVSRSVTREAVKMLTAKGLVSARPRQGTRVRPTSAWNLFDADVLRWTLERKFSVDLLRQFNELRIGIEPEAAALAARVHDDAQLAAIRAGLAAMAEADGTSEADAGDETAGGDPLQADIAFHVAILRATGNPFFFQFRTVVSTALRTSIRFTNRIVGHAASIADHRAVADAIAARDPEAARAAMRRLIGDVLTLIDVHRAPSQSPGGEAPREIAAPPAP